MTLENEMCIRAALQLRVHLAKAVLIFRAHRYNARARSYRKILSHRTPRRRFECAKSPSDASDEETLRFHPRCHERTLRLRRKTAFWTSRNARLQSSALRHSSASDLSSKLRKFTKENTRARYESGTVRHGADGCSLWRSYCRTRLDEDRRHRRKTRSRKSQKTDPGICLSAQ